MLSLAKLAADQGATYWLAQAQARVTHTQSVTSGVEDYYLAEPESAGHWAGSGAGELGLSGEVEPEALTRLLERKDPRTGEPLPRPSGRRPTVPGYDLMFSAPKSASILFGLGGPREYEAVLRAQREAVAAGMRYLERHACQVRRGDGGHVIGRGRGLVGAAFEHRTSRAGDPQIHTHVLVANLAQREDGLWAALDGRALYHEARAAGHVHEATFRRALTRELGVVWGPVHNGIADVDGITPEQRAAFSRRSTEIDEYLARHGLSGAEARQLAAVRTRDAKDYEITPAELAPEWRERAARLGLDRDALDAALDRGEFQPLGSEAKQAVAEQLVGPSGLTARASSFDRREIVCAFASAARRGTTLDEVEAFADRFLADERVVPLIGPAGEAQVTRTEAIQLRDGRLVAAMVQSGRYSTTELLAVERAVIERALAERRVGAGVAQPEAIQAALARRATIGTDQAEMVRRLCSDGDRVQVVVGPAGTGKTFALDAAREAWEASGYTVVGAAVARRAARRVEESTGIRSTSVAALQRDLRTGGAYGLGPRTVVAIDEAGMLGTRDLHMLVEHASRAGAKVVLVGDHRQLPEIDAGDTFRGLAVRTEPIVLTENRRQREEWARQMVDLIRHGDVRDGLALAAEQGSVVVTPTGEAAQAQLVRDWWEAMRDGRDAIMIAHRRAEVRALNEAARALMDDAGRLGAERVELAGGEFAAGDHVLFKRSSKALGLDNGDAGVIDDVDPQHERLTISLGEAGERVVQIRRDYLHADGVAKQPSLVHGYAATGHVQQGATADEAFVLGSPELYREWVYVAASRMRDRVRFYLADPDVECELDFHAGERSTTDAFDVFVRQVERSHAHTAALDVATRHDVAALSGAQLQAESHRLQRIIRQAPGPRLRRELASAEATLAEANRTAAAVTRRRIESEAARDGDRQATLDLARARSIEHDALLAVGQAMEHVHELRTGLAADRWAVDHADDLARYAAVRNELATRGRASVMCHRHVEIPEYLTHDLGDRPTSPHERGLWDRAAVRIEHFRVSYDIADPARALGDRPDELRARGAYDQARRDIALAKKQLAREQARRRGASRPPRQMTLGIGR